MDASSGQTVRLEVFSATSLERLIVCSIQKSWVSYEQQESENKKIREEVVNFMDAYLDSRIGRVVLAAQCSDDMEIANSIFQGTVRGLPLWNLFFPACRHACCPRALFY